MSFEQQSGQPRPEPGASLAPGSVLRRRPEARGAATEVVALLRLALPLALANVGQMLLGVVDTAVVGRLGEVELGATGLGNSVYFSVAILGAGVMHGLDPLVSQAVGAAEPGLARRTFWQGVWLALVLSPPLAGLMLGIGGVLEPLGIAPDSAVHCRDYVAARLPGLLPFLVYGAARAYLQGNSLTRPMLIGVILANLCNLPITWLLVFGHGALGVPALGVAGAGLASSFASLLQVLVLVWAIGRVKLERPESRWPDAGLLRRALSLGVPVGFTMLAEVGFFAFTNFAMGNLGRSELAAHQVALNLAALSFMVPLGVGAAVAVRVGHAVGRGDTPGARRAGFVGIGLGVGFMACSAGIFLGAPEALGRVITDQPDVLGAAVPLIFVAAVFQLSDGAQAVAAGALRGAGDTRAALVANVIGHYCVGLPLGLYLGFRAGLGGQGLWWGLSAGLSAVAVGLITRFALRTRRELVRV